MWNLYLNDTLYNDTLRETTFVNDNDVDGTYIHDFEIYWIPSEDITNDTTYVKIESLSISKEYYEFILGVMYETDWRDGMFDGSPANVSTNLTNGALGYFSASAVEEAELILVRKTD